MKTRMLGMRGVLVALSLLAVIPTMDTAQSPSQTKSIREKMAVELSEATVRGSGQERGAGKLVDIKGNPLTLSPDESYLAELDLPDGRVVIFRQNNRDIDALVEVFKTTGPSNARMADRKFWKQIPTCFFQNRICPNKQCIQGGGNHCALGGVSAQAKVVLLPIKIPDIALPVRTCDCVK
jgi:hypothetical protein